MNFKNTITNFVKNTNYYKDNFDAKNLTLTPEESILLKTLGIDINNITNDIKGETVYFTCLKILSETIGKLPLNMYQDNGNGVKKVNDSNWNKIRLRPNPYMSSTSFWTTLEYNRNHWGNGYAYLNFKGSKLKDMWLLSPECVQVYCDNDGIFGKDNALVYIYTDSKSGKQYRFNKDEILHVKSSYSADGIMGIAVKDVMGSLIRGNMNQQDFLNNLYKNGLTGRAVLQYTGDLNPDSVTKLVNHVEQFASGTSNAGKIIPIPIGMSLQNLDVKLTDAQFSDLKKLNANSIAGLFGLSPTFINNYDNSSYSNSESEMLAFLINTLMYILKLYEDEISYKLLTDTKLGQGYYFKFNEGALLRTNSETQAKVLASYVNNSIKTPNECRNLLDLESKPEGDVLIANGNYIPLTNVGQQYNTVSIQDKGGETNIE